ncbi:MAG: 30S ribosomal protein S7 [Candidatus Thermoplasmatota archaeon]|nr:30S ribosomal protein S7 [Candidatus Thermoplasmatota archaeon]
MEPENIPPLFGKYDVSGIVIEDKGLARYMNLDTKKLHQHARHANRRFKKANLSIIERLINNMMRTERYTGKKTKAYNTVKMTFDIIHKKTKENPLQIFIKAIENAAPREETTRLFLSGIYIPQAVDSAPLRRLDIALRNICRGAISSTTGSKKRIEACLADEIIKAYKDDPSSFAVSKKGEMERIAKSAR